MYVVYSIVCNVVIVLNHIFYLNVGTNREGGDNALEVILLPKDLYVFSYWLALEIFVGCFKLALCKFSTTEGDLICTLI